MNTSNDEKQFIYARLAAGDKHDTIAHALLMRRALEEVEYVAKELAAREHAQQTMMENIYYVILGPKPKAVKVRDDGGSELWQQSDRQSYKVLVKDFKKFCADMALDFKEMSAVAEGYQYDHRDWISAGNSGYHFDQTKAAPPPNPRLAAAQADDAAQYKAARTTKVKRMSSYMPSPERIDYTPKSK